MKSDRFLFWMFTVFSFAIFGLQVAKAGSVQTQKNLCLDVVDGKFVNGGAVQLWGCVAGSSNQDWSLSGGKLKTRSNKCLDVADGRAVNGGRLQLWDCVDGNANQAWEAAGSSIRHTGTNLCLDVTDGKYGNGASVQIYACDFRSTGNQVFSAAQGASSGLVAGRSSADAGTFYGYPVIGIDQFMAKNPGCAWIKDAVVAAAKDQNLHPTFLATACIVESSCLKQLNNPWGPFQFSDEGAWKHYGLGKDRQNVWDAAFGAARFFRDLLNQYNGDLDKTLRWYNGPLDQGGNPRYQTEYRIWMSGGNAWQ